MKSHIPPLKDVVDRLKELSEGEVHDISAKSGVSVSTVWKIRCGYTRNPGVETFRKLVAALPRKRRAQKVLSQRPIANRPPKVDPDF